MDDATLVAAARRGDRDAWGLVYDRYADRLHDHCWSILRDEHEAADALHDAFVNAARALPQLRDPSRLRPWLYAIARNEAFRRHRARARAVPTEDVDEMGEIGTVTVDLDEGSGVPVDDLRRLVWDAAGGLSADDQALLDLHLRQGLEGEELAEAMGITANNAYVKMSRLRDTLERSLGALLVARTGRRDCPELAELLAGWDGQLSPLLRKRIARHIEDCEVCEDRKKAMVSPLAMFAGMPMVPAPAAVRDRILDDAVAAAATAPPPAPDVLFPVPAAAVAGPATGAVPPVPPGTESPSEGGTPWWWILGGVAALIVLVVSLLIGFSGGGDDLATSDTTTSSTTSTSSTTTSSTTSTTTTSSTTTSTTAPAPAIALSTAALDFGSGSVTERRFTITNSGGGPLSYALGPSAHLSLSRATGTLAPGASHTVIVTLARALAPEGPFRGGVDISSVEAGNRRMPATATIAPRPPVIGGLTTDQPAVYYIPECPVTRVLVAFTDESTVTGVLHWLITPGDTAGQAALAPEGSQLSAALLRPLTPSPAEYEYWVVLTDALGATTESPHQMIDTAVSSCF